MIDLNAFEKASTARQSLADGDVSGALRAFKEAFFSCSPDLRKRLVLEMPEFFVGGDGVSLPEVNIDDLSSDWFELLCQMSVPERIGLFGLAVTIMPERMLEIGRARGGSTIILNAARKFSGCKHFVSLDPNWSGEHYLNERLAKLLEEAGVKLIHGFSPDENKNAVANAGGTFDFVFIDGDHSYESCLKDLVGVVDFLSPSAYVVLHDANYPGVQDAVDDVVRRGYFVDCGYIGRDRNEYAISQTYRGRPVIWGGLRLLQRRPSLSKAGSLLAQLKLAFRKMF